jgi:GT2 family glycosyltransferase
MSAGTFNRITVAFSTFREGYFEWVIELLEALERQTVKDFEVVIVVNRDKQYFKRLRSVVKNEAKFSYKMQVIFNPVDKGIAYARNIALKHARTPYIVYTDDDALPDPFWLEELVGTLELDERVGAATGPVLAIFKHGAEKYASWFPKALYWIIGCTPWDIKVIRPVRNGFASNLALRREVALKIGGFDEDFGYDPSNLLVGEEPEFGIRLLKTGYITLWNHRAKVYHRIPEGRLKMRNILMRAFVEGKTKAYLSKAHGKAAIKPEMGHLLAIVKAYVKIRSFKAKLLLLSTTIVVLTGYLVHSIVLLVKESR